MFCGKCGSEIKEGGKFCGVCGAPVQEELMQEAPVQKEAVQEEPVQMGAGAPVFDASAFNTPVNEPKKGKKKGIFVALAVVAAALAAVVSVCVVNAAGINNFLKKTFSSPEKYFQFVMEKEVSETSKHMGVLYSDMVSGLNYYDTSYSGEFSIELGEDAKSMMNLVKLAMEMSDMDLRGIDVSKFESLKVGFDMAIKDCIVSLGIMTDVNQVSLISPNFVMDMEQGKAYLQIPELSNTYLGLNDYAIGYYKYKSDEFAEMQEQNREMIKALPKQADIEKMTERYLDIVIKNIDKVSIGDQKSLKVEGITQKCTELEITIDGRTMKNIMEAVIEEALEDQKLEKMITEMAAVTDQNGEDSYEDFVESLKDMKTTLKDMAKADGEIEVRVYVDSRGNVIGVVMEIEEEDSNCSMLSATKGNNTAYEISLVNRGENVFEISGKGKESKGLLTGEFSVEAAGKPVADLEVSQLDVNMLKSGYLNGTVEFIPSSELIDALADELDVPVSSYLKGFTVLLDSKSSSKEFDWKVTLNDNGDKLLSVALAMKVGNGSKASLPDSDSVMMIEDSYDMRDYIKEADLDGLADSLDKTGVFSEWATYVKNAKTFINF